MIFRCSPMTVANAASCAWMTETWTWWPWGWCYKNASKSPPTRQRMARWPSTCSRKLLLRNANVKIGHINLYLWTYKCQSKMGSKPVRRFFNLFRGRRPDSRTADLKEWRLRTTLTSQSVSVTLSLSRLTRDRMWRKRHRESASSKWLLSHFNPVC